jgi:ComF family protein
MQSDENHFCWDCRAGLNVLIQPLCRQCGDPVEGPVKHEFLCSWCLWNDPDFDMARSSVRYRGPVRRALQAFKYAYATYLVRDFVPLLEACVRAHYQAIDFDTIVCVPLYRKKERERTYNQARLLAQGLARTLGVPFLPRALRRIRSTSTQTNLTARQRRENVHNAFRTGKASWIEGRNILLVDDVMTTGATVNECSRVLKKARAASVHVVTIARG